MFCLRCLVVIPLWFPGSALPPFLNKLLRSTLFMCVLVFQYPTTQPNHHGKHSFSPVLHKLFHYLVCLCCLSTLKFSYTLLYFFPCELSPSPFWTTTVFPFWCTTLASAQVLISFSNSASTVSSVPYVPSLRCGSSKSTSLFPFELLTFFVYRFVPLKVAIPVSLSSLLYLSCSEEVSTSLPHPIVTRCYFSLWSNVLIRVAHFPNSWIKISLQYYFLPVILVFIYCHLSKISLSSLLPYSSCLLYTSPSPRD